MCRNIASELREADAGASGSIRTAEAQRAEHKRLYDEVKRTANASDYEAYRAAITAWDAHIAGHKTQADKIRAGRVK